MYESNPYAPPKHDESNFSARPNDGSTAHLEAIRREHLNAEANVKGLGILLYLGAAGLLMTGLVSLGLDVFGWLSVALGVMLGLSGYWLRRFDRRGRLLYSIVVAIGVVAVLLGDAGPQELPIQLGRMFWALLFLAVIWSGKGSTVMTPHYRDVVIPATPHVKRKTSPVLVVLLGLLVLAIVVLIIVAAAG